MEEPQSVTEVPQALFKKRNTKTKVIVRKREATPPQNLDSESGYTTSEDEEGRQIKRRRKNMGLSASSAQSAVQRPTTKEQAGSAQDAVASRGNRDDATKASNWYDEEKRDAKKESTVAPAVTKPAQDGTYRGVANYSSYIQKNPNSGSNKVGPVKQSTNVRTITTTDFAPDVCKDYKQTGYCGFGDSCKFLHAREDYKQGWELDRQWEIDTKGKKLSGKTVASAANRGSAANNQNGDDEDDEALLESIPFACVICKKAYGNPIITKCGHYFCEACALKRYRKDPSCAVCGASTGGVFNTAKKLNRLLERKRERARTRRDKAMENGESVDEAESEIQPST